MARLYFSLDIVFLKKQMGHLYPLFHSFSSIQTNITIFTPNKCEKCPSSIQRWDSNLRPSEHESPHLTTRPGLPREIFCGPKRFIILSPARETFSWSDNVDV